MIKSVDATIQEPAMIQQMKGDHKAESGTSITSKISAIAGKIFETTLLWTQNVGQRACGLARTVSGIIKIKHPLPPGVDTVLKATKFLSILSIPGSVADVASSIKGIVTGKDKVGSGLGLVNGIGSLGSGLTSIAEALMAVGAFGAQGAALIAPILSPLSFVFTLFSAAGVVLTGRSFWSTFKFMKEFEKATGKKHASEYTPEDLKELIEFLNKQDDKDLKTHFKVNPTELKEAFSTIQTKIKENGLKDKDVQKIAKTLKGRVHSKLRGDALKIAQGVTGIAATAAIFVTPLVSPHAASVVVPICLTTLAVSTTVSIAKFVLDLFDDSHFEKVIGIDKSWKSFEQVKAEQAQRASAST